MVCSIFTLGQNQATTKERMKDTLGVKYTIEYMDKDKDKTDEEMRE